MVLNDEAHHCYREKPNSDEDADLKGDDKKEAEKNREAARLWISGLETVTRKLGTNHIIDLSATPFFLRGSGYAEGTLFASSLRMVLCRRAGHTTPRPFLNQNQLTVSTSMWIDR